MERLKRLDTKHPELKYFAVFFVFLFLYNLIYVCQLKGFHITDITYSYHLVDYKMGFVVSFFAGELLHLIFNNRVGPAQVTAFHVVLILFIFAFVSAVLAKIIAQKENRQDRKTLFLLSMFMLSGPCSFAIYTLRLGMLDIYFILFAVLFFIAVSNRVLKYTVPALYVLSVINHYSALVTVIMLFSLLLLYKTAVSEKKKDKIIYLCIFAVGIIAGAAMTGYLLKTREANLVYDMEGFNRELRRRCQENNTDLYYDIYYDSTIYRYYPVDGKNIELSYPIEYFFPHGARFIPAILAPALAEVLSYLKFNMFIIFANISVFVGIVAVVFLVTLPVLALFTGMWVTLIKNSENKLKKLIYVLAIIQVPFTFIGGCAFSGDPMRWSTFGMLMQFVLVFTVAGHEENAFEYLKRKISRINMRWLAVYFILYSAIVIEPY